MTREIDKDLTSLVKEADKVVAASEKGAGVLVLFSNEKAQIKEKLKDVAKRNKIEKVALTINGTGKKAPKDLKIDPKVKHTILVYEKKKVVYNFAFNKISKEDIQKFVAKAKEVLKPKTS